MYPWTLPRLNVETDFDILASRAVEPFFYRAPWPENPAGYEPKLYQHAAVEYSIARNNSLIGDAPGVGKTPECVLISNAIGAKFTLVICPASLRFNWEREIWRWSTIPNVKTYVVEKSRDGISHDHHYVIVSYALLTNPSILNAIMDVTWDHVVYDEGQAFKDPKGNTRTKIICAPDLIPSVVGRTTVASGTIMPNQPIECYNVIRLLNWEAINKASLEDFRDTYYSEGGGFINVYDAGAKKWVSKWSNKVRNVPVNLDDLQYRLRKNIMVRRVKEQVLHELPPKQWHLFPLSTTPKMREAMKHPGWKLVEKMHLMDPGAFNAAMPIDGAIATARRLLGEAKAPAVADYIEELIDEGVEKIVVGAWNHTVLNILRERLSKHGLVYMDGATSGIRKQAAVDSFQTDPDIKIILGQTMVIGEGWTLTVAQDGVVAEWDWVPGRNEQFLDRMHRFGQRGNVLGHVPVVPDTLDERMVATSIQKDIHIHAALDKA